MATARRPSQVDDILNDGEEETLPNYREIPKLKSSNIYALIERRLKVKAELVALEVERKEIDAALLPLMYKAELKGVMVGEEPVRVIEQEMTVFDKKRFIQRLFELRVQKRTIEDAVNAATSKKPKAPFIQVGKRGRKPQEEE